jgi:hypothetical protein
MDTNYYAVEQVVRDRLADARRTARCAAMLRQSKERLRRPNRMTSRLLDAGRSLIIGKSRALRRSLEH